MAKLMFFCSTYTNIVPTLALIDRIDAEEYIILTPIEQIKKFFDSISDKMKPNVLVEKMNINSNASYRHPIELLLQKRRLYSKYVADIRDYNIYFFFNKYAIWEFYLLSKLSKKNNIFFIDKDITAEFKLYGGIRSILKKHWYKLVLGIDVNIIDINSKPVDELNYRFFEKNKVQVLDNDLKSDEIEIIQKYKPNIGASPKIALIACSHSEDIRYNIIYGNSYQDTIEKVLEILKEKYSLDSIYYKLHPRDTESPGKIVEVAEEIPSFIPAEFVLSYEFRYIIGVSSTTLIDAAKNSKSRVISLINLVKFHSEDYQQRMKKWLEKEGENKILFPNTLNELASIISNN